MSWTDHRYKLGNIMNPFTTRFLCLALCLVPVGLIVPILEIGSTHVLNPHWPGHARLHEVWQLMTNSGLAFLCLWLAWNKQNVRLGSLIGLIIYVSFLMALLLSPLYGGTMRHSDGTELLIGSVNAATLIMSVAVVGLLVLFVTSKAPVSKQVLTEE